ncbi:SDR family NAD(P)-dependent oxidoreductase [Staphylococcus gallinarum]|uniref:SDR family NAD(P)-dependent oxidoreductase n=1 Tax=Staphylococcus gallinarum TaxID=1293 RepID=UPI002441D21B|nr:SDR family NAD(P)-dependent oxidoreductase [Staphylococcus gallinarum]
MKYTVITGASSGIGYDTALAFAKRDKNLILIARREDKMEQLKQEIKNINSNLDVVIKSIDLSILSNVYQTYESLNNYEIETWINNAGLGNFSPLKEQSLNKIEAMLNLNIQALTIFSTLFIKDYADVENTQLINVSSAGGYITIGNLVTYSATKFYVSAFTEGLAQELKTKNAMLKVKLLAPAVTETEFEQNSLGLELFEYESNIPQFNTSKEMAELMLQLYDSDKILGLVDENTYHFKLQDPIFPFRNA